jgi:cytochrome c-type biogenesis protein
VGEYWQAFALGNAAIIGNVCVLPLYPSLFVLMANGRSGRASPWLGVLVFAGLLTALIALGGVLFLVGAAVADILDWLLPVIYGAVAVLGLALLVGRSPFARLATVQAPVLGRPGVTAYVYGLFLAPMTLPCTGPLVVSAFVIGEVAGTGVLADSLLYTAVFALGFGWPLIVLPLLAATRQREVTRFFARHHRPIEIASGVLLLAIAAFGYVADIRPN